MSSRFSAAPTGLEADSSWLRLLRISALVALLMVVPGLFIGLGPLLPILAAPLVGCYLFVLFGVRDTPRRSALLLARAVGTFGSFSSVVVLLAMKSFLEVHSVLLLTYVGLFALAQAVAAVSAKKTLVSNWGPAAEKTRWPQTLAAVGVLIFALLLMAAISLPGLLRSRMAANESSSLFSVRTINECASAYAKVHPEQGFPRELSVLGPKGSGCLDDRLARGEKSGYVFTYVGGAQESTGPLIHYTVIARPVSYGSSAQRSFFSDASGGIRYTYEDRAANAEDPLLQ